MILEDLSINKIMYTLLVNMYAFLVLVNMFSHFFLWKIYVSTLVIELYFKLKVEGSTICFQGSREISGMQANPYYNFPPPQRQYMAFTHAHGRNPTYVGLYHPMKSELVPNSHPLLQQRQTLGDLLIFWCSSKGLLAATMCSTKLGQ